MRTLFELHRWRALACVIIVWPALVLWPGPALGQGNAPLITTYTNPTPAAFDTFGSSVSALGSDRAVVGAEGAREAYLLGLNGALLTTFTAPPNAAGFGASVAGVASERVMVGAYGYSTGTRQDGAAYLFNTNSTLVTTFTNPNPALAEAFGWAVAPLGSDRVLIGTLGPVAYLFRTNGALLATFLNPAPTSDGFGAALAAAGRDAVLVGAPYANTGATEAGAAYLFQTNGTLMTTFTNPVPVPNDNFGTSVAAVGRDHVLIGAVAYGGGASGGAAYLFKTNGALLTTFTNATPAAYDYFGWSVAAAGSTRVLIGAYQDGTGAFQAGSAYLFSTNGALLNTFTNPTPANQEWFGWSVASLGSDRVLVGAVWDGAGATQSGAAYLYALPYPPLGIARNGPTVSLSWLTSEAGLVLQQADVLATPTLWNDTTNTVFVSGLTNIVQQTISPQSGARFYRLTRR